MDNRSNHMDKWDYIIPISSGALTAALDVFFVRDISLAEAHTWGAEQTEKFVINTAKRFTDFKGENLASAVTALENKFPIAADDLTNDFGGGAYHHLRDFSHHPTLIGWLFNVVSQFTGKGYGTDTAGKFIVRDIPNWKQPDLFTGVFNGTIIWLFHMVSDIAGSSSTIRQGKEGTGLPGPLLAFLKELSSIPIIRKLTKDNEKGHNKFSVVCSKLFTGTLLGSHDENGKIIKGGELRFDLRTELGIGHEALANKQHIPVIINELIVSSFYSVSRFCDALQEADVNTLADLEKIDICSFLPWNSAALRRMRSLACTIFSAIDITVAGTKAAIKNKNNPSGFALDFLQSINYIGIARFTVAFTAEAGVGVNTLYGKFIELAEVEKAKLYASVPQAEETIVLIKKAATTTGAVLQAGTPLGFVSAAIGVYDEIARAVKDLDMAHEERLLIEEQCRIQVQILRENRAVMEGAVSQYMYEHLYSFGQVLDTIDEAARSGNAQKYVHGNALLQKQLGKAPAFDSLDDFDDLMASDAPLKL
jgi:hypothetical protein